jgi:Arc/MetJ-type ribon-helix-helix transcriptional regulator
MKKKDKFTISMTHELREEMLKEVEEGRYGTLSEVIEARCRQVSRLRKTNKDVAALFIECMELVAESPEVIEEFRKVWQKP